MQFKSLLAVALTSGAFAQDNNLPSLEEALRSNNSTLSGLARIIGTLPGDVVSQLNDASNITILAPNNEAIQEFLNNTSTAEAIASDPGLVTAVIFYHVLNGTYYASNLTESDTATQFIPTLLSNETFTNVTGGQVVEAITSDEGDVVFYSALKENSTVVEANLNFTGGTIHVIDRVLSVPQNLTSTLRDANLTAAAGAVQLADLAENLTDTKDITVFAPNNEAFARIASLAENADQSELQSILEYHVVEGQILYSDMISNNTTVQSLDNDTDLNITVIDGSVFVNNAQVVIRDLLIANGVVHVINNVLNPSNTTIAPDPSEETPAPAFNGTSATDGANPFTSGVEAPTTTAPVATGANPGGGAGGGEEGGGTSSSEQAAMPMRTAAVGVAALFGAAGAVALNL